MELINLENGKVTSLVLVKEINFFRDKEEKVTPELMHKNLLTVIRDEFDEEIGQLKIKPSSYINSQNKEQVMFELTINQAKQVLVRESKLVRKAVIKRLDELENNVPQLSEMEMIIKIANSKIEQDKRIDVIEDKLDNRMGLTGAQARQIGKLVSAKVYKRAEAIIYKNGMNTSVKEVNLSHLYSDLNTNLKAYYGISIRSDIPQSKYNEACDKIEDWCESFETEKKFDEKNKGLYF